MGGHNYFYLLLFVFARLKILASAVETSAINLLFSAIIILAHFSFFIFLFLSGQNNQSPMKIKMNVESVTAEAERRWRPFISGQKKNAEAKINGPKIKAPK